MPVAHPVLERDPPLPAARMRGRARERIEPFAMAARRGDRAVARQPVSPVLVTGLERLLDEQAAESRAVDEQLALDDLSVRHLDRFDVPILTVLPDVGDLALDPA